MAGSSALCRLTLLPKNSLGEFQSIHYLKLFFALLLTEILQLPYPILSKSTDIFKVIPVQQDYVII